MNKLNVTPRTQEDAETTRWYKQIAYTVNALVDWFNSIGSTAYSVLITNGSGTIGYGTGSGGTVTQATSKATNVTLNKPTGKITMNAAALAAGASVSFQFGNSLLGINDVLVTSICWDGVVDPSNYSVSTGVYQPSSGTAYITVKNVSAGSLSQAVQINFAIVKGSVA